MREQYLVKYVQEELMENKNKKHVNPSTINDKKINKFMCRRVKNNNHFKTSCICSDAKFLILVCNVGFGSNDQRM